MSVSQLKCDQSVIAHRWLQLAQIVLFPSFGFAQDRFVAIGRITLQLLGRSFVAQLLVQPGDAGGFIDLFEDSPGRVFGDELLDTQ